MLTTINLPEQWGYLLVGGMLVGLLVGHWYALIGSIAPVALLFTDPGGIDTELLGLVLVVYVPGALLAILIGLGGRRLLKAAAASRRRAASNE